MQKFLTLDEVYNEVAIWIEVEELGEVLPALLERRTESWCGFYCGCGQLVRPPIEEYGTTWRCWGRKPTNEEREIKWDE